MYCCHSDPFAFTFACTRFCTNHQHRTCSLKPKPKDHVGKNFLAGCAPSLTGLSETRLCVRREFDLLSRNSNFFFLSHCMARRTAFVISFPFRFYTPVHPDYFQRAEVGEWRKEHARQLYRRHIHTADSNSFTPQQHMRNICTRCFQDLSAGILQTDSPDWQAVVFMESDQSPVYTEVVLSFALGLELCISACLLGNQRKWVCVWFYSFCSLFGNFESLRAIRFPQRFRRRECFPSRILKESLKNLWRISKAMICVGHFLTGGSHVGRHSCSFLFEPLILLSSEELITSELLSVSIHSVYN